eukprot:sb/3473251/
MFMMDFVIYRVMFIWITAGAVVSGGSLCPIAIDNGFLVRSCGSQGIDEVAGENFKMNCLNSTATYFKFIQLDIFSRSPKAYVSSLCPNDTTGYQACGDLPFDTVPTLFQKSPVCGKLCYEREVKMYGFHTTSQTCPSTAETSVGYKIHTVEGKA